MGVVEQVGLHREGGVGGVMWIHACRQKVTHKRYVENKHAVNSTKYVEIASTALGMFRVAEVDNSLPDLPPLFAVNKDGIDHN